MPGICKGVDELWEAGDEDARAQEYCDEFLAIAKAGDPFPALFAGLTRAFETLDRIRCQEETT